ncbi:MAG: Rho termination factor N-terminal domain-containing protein, partial [Actinobacteria bacterium]|nr:Rho termination factor N-terminal domain-containing protein [Actinomycetota bacterium]
MSESVLERSVLERKERDELQAIARAMGVQPAARARKADLVDLILATAGITPAVATDPTGGVNDDAAAAPAPRPRRRSRSTTTSTNGVLALDAGAAGAETAEPASTDQSGDPSPSATDAASAQDASGPSGSSAPSADAEANPSEELDNGGTVVDQEPGEDNGRERP